MIEMRGTPVIIVGLFFGFHIRWEVMQESRFGRG
jgi:hypothetical protein